MFLLLITVKTFPQDSKNSVAFPLKSFSLNSNSSWLSTIFKEKIADNIQIVGLGEFSHGGHENVIFKAKMIQYLVEEKGYRQILFEYPDVSLTGLNDYLLAVNSYDLDSMKVIIKHAFGYDVRDSSFSNLLIWLKQYNLDHADDKVSLRGFDIEGASSSFADYFMYTYLIPIDYIKAVEIQSELRDSSKNAITVAELKWFDQNIGRLKQALNKEQYEHLLYKVKAAKDQITHTIMKNTNVYGASAFRDSVMAENIQFLNTGKAILWSHNMHITTAPRAVSLGKYLKAKIGKGYFSILTDFSNKATVWVANSQRIMSKKSFSSNKRTTAAILNRKFGIEEGIVFFNDIKKINIEAQINDIDIFGNYRVIGGGSAFDALVIFKRVSPLIHN